jgi:hypothetical protein
MSDILSDLSAFSNPFGAPSKGQWNLTKAVYTTQISKQSVIFYYDKKDPDPSQKTALEQINDGGGRRLAVYEYPYLDGQAVADLGRKGEQFTFNIVFHGLNYQQLFQQFLNVVVNSNEPGTLTHPVRGAIQVRYRDHEFIHRHDMWNAITIKATFIEDNTGTLASTNVAASSQDSALRSALQTLTAVQATVQQSIFAVQALLLLPSAIANAMQQRLNSIIGQGSSLLGSLTATFSSDHSLQQLAAQGATTGGIIALNSGTTVQQPGVNQSGTGVQTQLPPVYQVGFDPQTQSAVNSLVSNFVNANQLTSQQAVFLCNQVRSAIAAAIAEAQTNFGNQYYDIMITYRGLAVAMQQVVEACLASEQSQVVVYTVPYPMSLRMVAFLNGLTPDDSVTIAALNPTVPSINYVPADTQPTVPAA